MPKYRDEKLNQKNSRSRSRAKNETFTVLKIISKFIFFYYPYISCINYQANMLYNMTSISNSSIDTYFTKNPEKLSIKDDILDTFFSWVCFEFLLKISIKLNLIKN